MINGGSAYWRLFLEPMRYNFAIRVPALNKQLSWLFINLFPTIYFALCGVGRLSLRHLLTALVLWFGIHYLYEFGYIYNDAIAVKREATPTRRLSRGQQQFAEKHLLSVFAVRFLTYAACMALVWFLAGNSETLIAIVLSCFTPILFYAYNRWRSTSNVWLYFWLVVSRFLPFAFLFESENHALLAGLLVLIYPLEIGIERFSRPQKRFPLVAKVMPTEESKPRFRTYYYTFCCVVLGLLASFQLIDVALMVPFVLFLFYRAALYGACR